MVTRRDVLKLSAAAMAAPFVPAVTIPLSASASGPFRFSLNTSTISGQHPGLPAYIDIAAEAGYDGVELWVRDIQDWLKHGNDINTLAAHIKSKKLRVENAISFTEWAVDDDARRDSALANLESEMKLVAQLGCKRIAAPPAGLSKDIPLNIEKAAIRYRETLKLGRKYGVMPLLEFWGASGTLFNISQALAIAAAANDTEARILPDVYHLFRGGSGFDCLELINGRAIDIIHMNDYPSNKALNELTDADRVYPGDGSAPLVHILELLKSIGGTKTLSLELFNQAYWKQDAVTVAKTGLAKMKAVVAKVMAK